VSPRQVVDAALARLAPHYDAKGVVLHAEIPKGSSDAIADKDRIVQVLTNLLSNALRYTPPGGAVTVVANTVDDTVRFDVRDTGIGIPPEHLAHVFERFYRVDLARSRALGGSGVGLTIARALVEAQGGRIRAESAGAGQGSTFSVTLPRA
jgi:signal transduction histidine kinase